MFGFCIFKCKVSSATAACRTLVDELVLQMAACKSRISALGFYPMFCAEKKICKTLQKFCIRTKCSVPPSRTCSMQISHLSCRVRVEGGVVFLDVSLKIFGQKTLSSLGGTEGSDA